MKSVPLGSQNIVEFTPSLPFSQHSLLESVWTELQELDRVKAARTAAGELLVMTAQAKEYMQDRLNCIRDMYEGGEPPL
jgi:hypothetical protein